MVALETPALQSGWKAAPFSLKGIDGKTWSLEQARGPKGLLVMFICNHCPYVKAIVERLVSDVKQLQAAGIDCIAIMSNDVDNYPDDSFDNMKLFAKTHGFTFPYVIDETQAIARAYDAVCTPDFFGFDAALKLQYRGRLDESGRNSKPDAKRELLMAMHEIAQTGKTSVHQVPSIGCNIKWKA